MRLTVLMTECVTQSMVADDVIIFVYNKVQLFFRLVRSKIMVN